MNPCSGYATVWVLISFNEEFVLKYDNSAEAAQLFVAKPTTSSHELEGGASFQKHLESNNPALLPDSR